MGSGDRSSGARGPSARADAGTRTDADRAISSRRSALSREQGVHEGEEEGEGQDPHRIAVRGGLPRRHAVCDRWEGDDQPLAVAVRAFLREEDSGEMDDELW